MMLRGIILGAVVACLATVGWWASRPVRVDADEPKAESATETASTDAENPFPRRYQLPAGLFDGGTAWINTAGPMPLPKLRGKVVLLDFWTFCCINCIHVLPDLEKLEREFPNELVVIGVHSAKFEQEKVTDNIRSAVKRYGIRHAVVNDANHTIWNGLGVESWPTLVLIDPQGGAVRPYSGEGNYERIRADVKKLVAYHSGKGTLDRRPLHIQTEDMKSARTPLRYPGKVVADPATKRLAIADSSHHRLVIADLDTGKVQSVIGDGVPQLKDGDFQTARFNDPQGMAFQGDKLYVADRKNHALRLVDLSAKTVTTLAGNGQRGYDRSPSARGKELALASPWDVLIVDGSLYIAMAGTHQIWWMKLNDPGFVRPFAGSGMENIADGASEDAAFAQPSGLSTDGKHLFVADSETSSVRAVDLTNGQVKTILGRHLFYFGDVDGLPDVARLQHALGVSFYNGKLFVADTYNNKLKTLDPHSGAAKTFAGDGKRGASDSPPRFDEPGGISVAGGKLYVADTNSHRVCTVDPATAVVKTIALAGLAPPEEKEDDSLAAGAKVVEAKSSTKLKPAGPWTFTGSVTIPTGTKLNGDAPMTYKVWKVDAGGAETKLASGSLGEKKAAFSLKLKSADLNGAGSLRIAVTYYPCETGSEGVCRILTKAWKLPIVLDPAGASEVKLPEK